MTSYRPPVYNAKKQSLVVMNEQTFPTLSKMNTSTKDPSNHSTHFYMEKLKKKSLTEVSKTVDPKIDELPEGWIILDGKYSQKKKINNTSQQEVVKEEKVQMDGSALIHLWKKRRDDYINLYGEENYKNVFGYGVYNQFNNREDETESNGSNGGSILDEIEEDMSSVE